jgi:hypothetical protein
VRSHFINTAVKQKRCARCARSIMTAYVEGQRVTVDSRPLASYDPGDRTMYVLYGSQLYPLPSTLRGTWHRAHSCPGTRAASAA